MSVYYSDVCVSETILATLKKGGEGGIDWVRKFWMSVILSDTGRTGTSLRYRSNVFGISFWGAGRSGGSVGSADGRVGRSAVGSAGRIVVIVRFGRWYILDPNSWSAMIWGSQNLEFLAGKHTCMV